MPFESRSDVVPRLTIGIPVRNGENYLERALETLLAQTFTDLEVLVADNASTDATCDIVRDAAERDPRVHLHRHEANLGAAPNYNFLADHARTELFKWAAHDDEYEPEFLTACVDALDADRGAVLAYTATVDIDAEGRVIGPADEPPRADHPDVAVRFGELLRPRQAFQIFSVMRTPVLLATGRHRLFPDGDLVTIAEMALHGRFAFVDRPLFRRREHPDRSMRKLRRARDRVAFFDTSRADAITWPTYRLGWEYLGAVRDAPLTPAEKRACVLKMGGWVRCYAPDLLRGGARSTSLLLGQLAHRPLRAPQRAGPTTDVAPGPDPSPDPSPDPDTAPCPVGDAARSSVPRRARTSTANVATTTAVPATSPSWTRR
ncbi:MAG TPA: glycosyltransferase family A protein [Acidimicrobiales bacterium]|nr:glycosyltransferase family A protein [Acidimicrobiales bacterium]